METIWFSIDDKGQLLQDAMSQLHSVSLVTLNIHLFRKTKNKFRLHSQLHLPNKWT